MGFTSWVDGRIAVAVKTAVDAENAALRQDIKDVADAVAALPAEFTKDFESLIDQVTKLLEQLPADLAKAVTGFLPHFGVQQPIPGLDHEKITGGTFKPPDVPDLPKDP